MPIVTYIIIGITCLVSFAAFNDPEIKGKYIFNAYLINHKRQWYRFFTHAVLHADIPHLLFNMMTLYFFGPFVESVFVAIFGKIQGEFFYILLYVSSIIMSSYYSFEKHKEDMYYNALGASGAVCAILFAYIIINPMSSIFLMFIPIGIPGFLFGILYLVLSSYLAKRGQDNIGHDAHFWGGVYGVVFTIAIHFQFLGLFVDQVKFYLHSYFG